MFWLAFTDLPRLLAEAPGLTIRTGAGALVDTSSDGDSAHGRLRLRVGSTTITYEGSATVARTSSDTCVLELAVLGKQVRGVGSVRGTIRFELHRIGAANTSGRQHGGDTTRVVIQPDLRFTGRAETLPTQTMRAAASRFADEWLDRLVEQFQRPAPAPDRQAAAGGERPALTRFDGDRRDERRGVARQGVKPVATGEAVTPLVPSLASPEADAASAEPGDSVDEAATTRPPESERPMPEPDLWPLGGPTRPPWSAIFGGAVALVTFFGVLAFRRLRRFHG
jgi:hypothetical protein